MSKLASLISAALLFCNVAYASTIKQAISDSMTANRPNMVLSQVELETSCPDSCICHSISLPILCECDFSALGELHNITGDALGYNVGIVNVTNANVAASTDTVTTEFDDETRHSKITTNNCATTNTC